MFNAWRKERSQDAWVRHKDGTPRQEEDTCRG